MGERVRVLDLVERYAALAGLPAPRVRVTGLLPGEKQHETLVATGERQRPTGVDRVLRCRPVARPPGFERVLSRAVERGEIPHDVDVETLAEIFPAVAYQRVAARGLLVVERDVVRVVDNVLLPALRPR